VLREDRRVRYASHVDGEGQAFYDAADRLGVEGILAKLRRSRYEPGRRSTAWLKIKIRPEQELVVGGWSRDNLVRQAAFKGLELGHDPRAVVRERAVATARAVVEAEAEAQAEAGARAEAEAGTSARAGRPEVVRSGGRSARKPARAKSDDEIGTPAAARTSARRPARPKSDDRGRESLPTGWTASSEELDELDRLGAEGAWQIGGETLKLTNLDKVLFPAADGGEALTKRDLVRYYATVGATLVPHLAGRGLTLQRFPDGIERPGFWQKDLPGHAPSWVTRWSYTGHEGQKTYVVVDRVATLAWLAQEAAVELHPWTSRTDAPQAPTFALIDIDPGTETSFEEVLVLARLYRTALQHLGVIGLPKVTGKRGIQAWIPVRDGYTFEQTRAWVELLSRAVGQMVPDLVSWEWSKRDRGGRARLDFTQNAVNKTLVAPYSARPSPGAPVSAPITWDELDDPALAAGRWTVSSLPERLAQVGDLFGPALDLRQELPPI
jgi:bifunctional non-homologous end joining protein LigD